MTWLQVCCSWLDAGADPGIVARGIYGCSIAGADSSTIDHEAAQSCGVAWTDGLCRRQDQILQILKSAG